MQNPGPASSSSPAIAQPISTNQVLPQGDQLLVSSDPSIYREGSWATGNKGTLYSLAGEYVSKYQSHNFQIDAAGNIGPADTTGNCQIIIVTQSGLWNVYAGSGTAGVAPTLSLVSSTNLNYEGFGNGGGGGGGGISPTLDSTSNSGFTLSNGNLTVSETTGLAGINSQGLYPSPLQVEVKINSFTAGNLEIMGFSSLGANTSVAAGNLIGVEYNGSSWIAIKNAAGVQTTTSVSGLTAPAANDVYSWGLNMATRALVLKQNGTTITMPAGYTTVPGNDPLKFQYSVYDISGSMSSTMNFGATPYAYPITGYGPCQLFTALPYQPNSSITVNGSATIVPLAGTSEILVGTSGLATSVTINLSGLVGSVNPIFVFSPNGSTAVTWSNAGASTAGLPSVMTANQATIIKYIAGLASFVGGF